MCRECPGTIELVLLTNPAENLVPRIIVNVMPKPELLDPQGKAITRALARNGVELEQVRQGKRFELTIDGPVTDSVKATIERIASEVLANTVIEDVTSIEYEA